MRSKLNKFEHVWGRDMVLYDGLDQGPCTKRGPGLGAIQGERGLDPTHGPPCTCQNNKIPGRQTRLKTLPSSPLR